jgi:hypothetical protein
MEFNQAGNSVNPEQAFVVGVDIGGSNLRLALARSRGSHRLLDGLVRRLVFANRRLSSD